MAAMAAGLQRSTTRTDYSEHSTRLSSTDRHYLLTDIFDVVVSGEPLHVATRNRTATTADKTLFCGRFAVRLQTKTILLKTLDLCTYY